MQETETPRSYVVETKSGATYRRNSHLLREHKAAMADEEMQPEGLGGIRSKGETHPIQKKVKDVRMHKSNLNIKPEVVELL